MSAGDFYIDEEEAKTKGLGLRLLPRVWPFFSRYKLRVSLTGLMVLGSSALGLAGPLLIKHAIDADITQHNMPGLWRTALLYLVIQLAVFVLGYFQRIQLTIVSEKAVADLKEKLYAHILKLPMSFFDRNPVGRLITRTESDSEALKQLFAGTAIVIAQDLVMLVGMSVVMAIVNWRLFLIIVVLFPPILFGFAYFQKRIRPTYLKIRRMVAETNNFITETLRGLPVVQAMNRQEFFVGKMGGLNQEKFGYESRIWGLMARIWTLWDLGEALGTVLIMGFGGFWALKGMITIGGLFMFYSYIARVFAPIRGLSDQINTMQRASASAERMFGIFDTLPEPSGRLSLPDRKFSDAVRIEHVNFAYEGRETVLKDINLEVRKGDKVALVGETGSGKTSIVGLLLKFYEAQQGRITIDGLDLRELDNLSLRRRVGFVPQEVILFPGTVLDNLRLFDETVNTEQVQSAARRARIHERILQFPQGYETNLVERGINLSLGERQLLAFARALVFDPEILILDEATSSVDPHTEHLIQEGLEELIKDRTAIIIAHRLATIEMVDRIVVVHKGQIVQEGSHRELVEQDGYYRRLYRLQYLSQESV